MKLTIRRSFPRYNYHYQYKSAQTSEKLFVVEIPPHQTSWPLLLAGISISTDQPTPGMYEQISI